MPPPPPDNGLRARVAALEQEMGRLRDWKHKRADPALWAVDKLIQDFEAVVNDAIEKAFRRHEQFERDQRRDRREGLSLWSQFLAVAIAFAGVGAAIAEALIR